MPDQGSPDVMPRMPADRLPWQGLTTASWLGCCFVPFNFSQCCSCLESVFRLPGSAHTHQTGVLQKREINLLIEK